jgi:hypothetical protein
MARVTLDAAAQQTYTPATLAALLVAIDGIRRADSWRVRRNVLPFLEVRAQRRARRGEEAKGRGLAGALHRMSSFGTCLC